MIAKFYTHLIPDKLLSSTDETFLPSLASSFKSYDFIFHFDFTFKWWTRLRKSETRRCMDYPTSVH